MSDFSINGVKSSGSIYELKPGVTIKEAFEKGKNDKIDQVYFEANGKNYVLQGEGLNLNGLSRGVVPANQVNLDGKKIQVEIDGKKVEAILANSVPENEIEINGKTIKAKIISVDDEVNSKGEAFKKGITSIPGQFGISIGGLAVGVGVIGGSVNFLGEVPEAFRNDILTTAEAGKVILAGVAIAAVTIGATGLYGMYKESKTTANPEQLKPLLGKAAEF